MKTMQYQNVISQIRYFFILFSYIGCCLQEKKIIIARTLSEQVTRLINAK
jgi:hypothetical protein